MEKSPSPTSPRFDRKFIYVACQVESQEACKHELINRFPELKFSFSRPGFVTFKLPEDHNWPLQFDLKSTFARTYGWCLGKLDLQSSTEFAKVVEQHAGDLSALHRLHVWSTRKPIGNEENRVFLHSELFGTSNQWNPDFGVATADDWVLDAMQTDPGKWWLGIHRADQIFQRWPGGVPILSQPDNMVSRAYLKTSEALLWSRLPIGSSDVCIEIGSAPGGSCQKLLELKSQVIAIDPADLDKRILDNPRLKHIKKRGRDVRHSELANAKWLLVDSNVAPSHTLDTVEAIAESKKIHLRGMLITLKILDWKMAEQIPEHIARVKGWGFGLVKTRQLAFGRQEVCLMALKNRASRRVGRTKR